MKKLLAVTVLLLLSACKIPPIDYPSPPTPTPTPTPAPVVCLPDIPWCSDTGQTCSTPGATCKHNPTQDPAHCELAPACAEQPVPPDPPVVECNPVLNPALGAPANDDANWEKSGDQTTSNWFKQSVWQAVSAAKAACPKVWSGDCLKAGEPGIDAGYLLISKELQKMGIAASQAQDSADRKYDHLWVRGPSAMKDWNATKLFNYGNGCLITGDGAFTAHGWYTFVGDDPTPPPPTPERPPVTPPPAGACPATPCPDLVWTEATLPDGWSNEELGRPRMQFNSSTYVGRWKDNTLVVKRNEPYCASIGMSPMADGQLRAACPLRPDGHVDREALEAWASGGFKLESQNGATCMMHPTNPVMFELNGGNCRLCTVRTFKEGKPLCGDWF